jgi:hypothetical protein
MSNTEFSTEDLDLAAAIVTATRKRPRVCKHTDRQLVTFIFPNDEPTQAVILAYAGGTLIQNVRKFAACRFQLYRLARANKEGHR